MKLIKFLSLIILALVITNVTLTNRSVDESLVVSDMTRQIATLQNDNAILKAEVAKLGSISTLRAQIEAAGFVDSPKVVSISAISSVASR